MQAGGFAWIVYLARAHSGYGGYVLFGAVFGIAIVTVVFNAHGGLASPAAITRGYRPALAVAAGFSVLAAAVAALGLRRPGGLHTGVSAEPPGRVSAETC